METPSHLVNEHYNDRYFDVVNAVEEAKGIYFEGNRLLERVQSENESFTIGETGFGAGRTLLALVDYLDTHAVTNRTINYYSVELHPISPQRMLSILESFRDKLGGRIDSVVNAYGSVDISIMGWHSFAVAYSCGVINVKLWIGEALEMVNALDVLCDAWFLDGHGPKKNPMMWRPELFRAIGKKTVEGGTCATFTVAGHIRRDLMDAHFVVDKWPGFGGKKEVLRGQYKNVDENA